MATFSLQNSIRLELPLFYSTYLGGGDDEDLSSDGDLAIDSAGTDLVYSAHWDGGGLCIYAFGSGVAIASQGHAYVIGTTDEEWPQFPFRRAFQVWIGGPFYQGQLNGFVMKMNPAGTAADYSSLLGGTGLLDLGNRIVLDASNNGYVAGLTESTDFPITQSLSRSHMGAILTAS